MPYKVHCRYTVRRIKYFLIKCFSLFYMKTSISFCGNCYYCRKQFILEQDLVK